MKKLCMTPETQRYGNLFLVMLTLRDTCFVFISSVLGEVLSPECDEKPKMKSLAKHIKTVHRVRHNLKCQLCGLGCRNMKQHEKHVTVLGLRLWRIPLMQKKRSRVLNIICRERM